MDKAKEFLGLTGEESESVSRLTVHPHRAGVEPSFYEEFNGLDFVIVEPK
jgi:acyl-coenzyme A thioesterase 13